ncbi:hypothetical protein K8R43_04160 [archaeon]|nr:hypothetical protein [archaeon]
MEENLAGALAYLFGFVSGLLLFFIEKKSTFVRFHAMQSMLLAVGVFVLSIVLGVGLTILSIILAMISPAIAGIFSLVTLLAWLLLVLVFFLLWIFLMFKAYQGAMFKLPVIGNIAEKQKNI